MSYRCSTATIGIVLFVLLSTPVSAEVVFLKSGEKLEGDIVITYNKGVLFREEEGAPGRYYAYDEINRISTKDGMLYYLMPRGKTHKKKSFSFFPFAKILLPSKIILAPVPYITSPGGEAIAIGCAGAEDPVTIKCKGGTKVRLLGLEPPPDSVGQKALQDATGHLSKLVSGKTALLFPGPQDPQSEGLPQAYVLIDNAFINAKMIENGWARAAPPRVRHPYGEAFSSLQKFARNLERGIWGPSSAAK